MSKYDSLWKFLKAEGKDAYNLSFDEIKSISGVDIEHSFLTYKNKRFHTGMKSIKFR